MSEVSDVGEELDVTPPIDAGVRVGISLEPSRQSRWSIFFRIFLVVPLSIVAYGIEFAGFFIVIAAWFASLVKGRVPDRFQRFLTRAVRFYANFYGYIYLLTNRWPEIPWAGSSEDQVTIEVDHVDLRRSAVLFRLVLMIPAMILGACLGWGSYILLIVMWFSALIAGHTPRTLHQAVAAILRYQVRLSAYALLITPTQPFQGLLGDEVESKADLNAPSELDEVTSEPLESPTVEIVHSEPLAPASAEPISADNEELNLPTWWALTRAARRFVVAAVIVGGFFFGAYFTAGPAFHFSVTTGHASSQEVATAIAARTALNTAASAQRTYDEEVAACDADPTTGLSCIQTAASTAASNVGDAINVLDDFNPIPDSMQVNFNSYTRSLLNFQNVFVSISNAPSTAAVAKIIATDMQPAITNVNQSYDALIGILAPT